MADEAPLAQGSLSPGLRPPSPGARGGPEGGARVILHSADGVLLPPPPRTLAGVVVLSDIMSRVAAREPALAPQSALPDGYSPSSIEHRVPSAGDEHDALLSQQLFDHFQGLLRVRLSPPIPPALARQFFEYARDLHGLALHICVRHGFRGGTPIPTYEEIESSFQRLTGRSSLVSVDPDMPWLRPWPPWGGPGGGGGGGGGPKAPKKELSLKDWIVKFLGAIPGLGEVAAVADLMVEQGFLALFAKLRRFLLGGQIGRAVDVVLEIIEKMLGAKFRKALVKKLGKKTAFKIIGALTGLSVPIIGWAIAALAIVWALIANL